MITPKRLKVDADMATSLDMGSKRKLTNKAVEVVPILAPTTMGMAVSRVKTPWLIKTIANPTTTELD